MDIRAKILAEKHLLLVPEFKKNPDIEQCAYFNAFLLTQYGVRITNPEYVTDEALLFFDDLLFLHVPEAFYRTPQDTKLYRCGELFLEQVVSYYIGYGTTLGRVELFEKDLPPLPEALGRFVARTYTVINEEQGNAVLKEVMKDLCAYKRPFSEEEVKYFTYLVNNDFYQPDMVVECRDNIFYLLEKYPYFAEKLDKKDLVKFSLNAFGYLKYRLVKRAQQWYNREIINILATSLPRVRDCPLSRRQAKLYNKVVKMVKGTKGKEDNSKSPYKEFIRLMKEGKTLAAAEYLSKNGSLLERNLRFLLSRAKDMDEVDAILNLLDDKNPAVLFQWYSVLCGETQVAQRIFTFTHERKKLVHVEKAKEVLHRKSILSEEVVERALDTLCKRIESHFAKAPRLGKIYVSPEFKKVALPLDTASSGKGVDVLPRGSRIPFDGRYIRIFCHWEDVFDIDASLVVLRQSDMKKVSGPDLKNTLNWRTYYRKPFGDDALISGDITSITGTEYQDLDVAAMAIKRKCLYAIACIDGFGGKFDQGRIIQGLQIKDEINEEPWDPKNIEFQMNVVGPNRSFTGFAVDLKAKEIIVVNTLTTGGRIIGPEQVHVARRFLNPRYLDVNMYTVLSKMGEVVETPEEADVVFDRNYQSENQTVVRPFDVPKLIAILNGKGVE